MKYLASIILLISLPFLAIGTALLNDGNDLWTVHRVEIRLVCAIAVGVFLLAARLNRNGHKGNRDVAGILCILFAAGMLATFLPKPDANENWKPAFSILLPFSIPVTSALLTMLWPDESDAKPARNSKSTGE